MILLLILNMAFADTLPIGIVTTEASLRVSGLIKLLKQNKVLCDHATMMRVYDIKSKKTYWVCLDRK